MPTEKRILAALSDIEETLEQLDHNVEDILGPYERGEVGDGEVKADDEGEIEDETATEGDEHTEELYFLLAESGNDRYYIAASTERQFMTIVYPYYITSYLADQVPEDQYEDVLDIEFDAEDATEQELEGYREQVGEQIIQNTPIESCWNARFYLSAYASTSDVSYHTEEAENGFPAAFQTTNTIYPYSDLPELGELHTRILSALNMGKRGKRYVESSLYVDESDDEELVIRNRF